MKTLRFTLGGLVGSIALLGACSTSSSSSPPDTSAVDSFVQSMAQNACDWEFKCCKDSEIKSREAGKYTTKDACLQYQQLLLENTLYVDRLAVREGRLRVDSAHASACIQQGQAQTCNSTTVTPPPTTTQDDCSKVFVGNTPVGSECIYPKECVDGAHCVSAGAVGHGVCVPFQKVGDICNGDTDCDPSVTGIYCAKQDFKCHVKGKEGEACAYTTDSGTPQLPMLLQCDTSAGSNLYCNPSSKTCTKLPGDGQACLGSPLPPGVASRCNPDPTLQLVCDTTAGAGGTCRAPGRAGSDCTNLPCEKNLYCARNGATNVCTALPGIGQPCNDSGFQCIKPYFCDTTQTTPTCAQAPQLGQPCPQGFCDAGLFCDGTSSPRTCKALLADGSSCTSSTQCASQICSGFPNGTCLPTQAAVCSGR